jgi:hypothetical protein
MSALLDMDMLMSGDFILHFDEQHFDDEGHDQLPSIGKEIEPFNDNHHPLISKVVPNQANLQLVFKVNILDFLVFSHVYSMMKVTQFLQK